MIRQIHRAGRNATEKLLHRLKRQRKKSQDNVIGEEKKETLDDLNIGIMPGHNSSPHPPHVPPSTAESLSFNFNRGAEGEGGWKTEDG